MVDVYRERILQNNVKSWLINDLGYTFLGNLSDQSNECIKEELLVKNLKKRGYKQEQINAAVYELRNLATNQVDSLYNINKEIYSLLRYGKQGVKDNNNNRQTVHYIDWDNIDNNDFYLAEEVTVICYNGRTRKRPDLVIYVNGIALAVFELKRSCVSVGEGIRQNLTNQKKEYIQQFFNTVQLVFTGNEAEGLRYGTIKTTEKYFLKWKEDVNAKDELSTKIKKLHTNNRLKDGIISLCHKERFLSFIHDFIIYDAGIKKVARHNQYFANIAARKNIIEKEGGIIWNTQGSGKSLIMVWLTKWIIENIDDSRVVIITDREELDDQIESLFIDVGESVARAKSSSDLHDLLNKKEENIICSLIHKYGHNAGTQADIDKYLKELVRNLPPNFEAKGNIVAFIDECHRTNSGKLHDAVRTIMPNATLIGFTGTPLLKKDKKTSLEVFGPYIHTYKFDEGVSDGVVLDLRYEARDVDQDLSSKEKLDLWFESKTVGLTENAKVQLKRSWTSMNMLYSSKQRLEKIATDIIFDMNLKSRLKNNRGTALLVANSIYEACRYWDIFNSYGFTKCAVVTSFEPNDASVRTATSDLNHPSEDEYKKYVYDRMLDGKRITEFEKDAKEKFVKEPASMKLLIVVDKLLTGFDAPSATYIYIDKSMRDHDLFQAICRVNRPDGDDKDYGYIVDYMDLFKNLESAISDYTSEAFENYDKEDIDGLIKGRYDEAKAEMVGSMASLGDLFQNIGDNPRDTDYIKYFCGNYEESDNPEFIIKRELLYSLTSSLTRSFANCVDKLVSNYNYSKKDVENIRKKIYGYNRVKEMIRLASNDYIDLKPYESDMRYILDTYIKADDSKVISKLNEMSLVELLIEKNLSESIVTLVDDLPGDKNAKAETIANNMKHEIVKKIDKNPKYYGKLSEMLEQIIEQRRIDALEYEEYLNKVVEIANLTLHPENSGKYPESIKSNEAKRALYDYFENEEIAISINNVIKNSIRTDWKNNQQKQRLIKKAIFEKLKEYYNDENEASNYVEEIFNIIERHEEYEI